MRLTSREADILHLSVAGTPRSYLATRLGISENTLKVQIRSILGKANALRLADVVWRVRNPS